MICRNESWQNLLNQLKKSEESLGCKELNELGLDLQEQLLMSEEFSCREAERLCWTSRREFGTEGDSWSRYSETDGER